MALTQLTKVDGGGISTTSDYRVGIITAIKFVGPFDGTGGNFTGVVTASSAIFAGDVSIGGTLTYEDVTNIDSVGIITAKKDIHVGAGISAVGVITGRYLNPSSVSTQNVIIGWEQSTRNVTGSWNVLLGRRAGESLTSGGGAVCIGANAGQLLGGSSGIFIGAQAGSKTTGSANLFIGSNAGQQTTSAGACTIIGHLAGIDNQGSNNTILGYYAGRGNSGVTDGAQNTFIGAQSGFKIQGGDDNTGLGYHSLRELLGGNKNVAIGRNAGNALVSGNNNIIIGYDADASTSTTSNEITLGDANINHLRIPGIGVSFNNTGGTQLGIITATELDISGDIDVDGHTNLDNVSVAGVTTFASGNVRLASDSQRLQLGSAQDLWMYHTGTSSGGHGLIQNEYGYMYMLSSGWEYRHYGTNQTTLKINANNAVTLYYQNSGKLSTTSIGAQIDTTLRLYGAAGSGGGRLRLAEGAAYSEIRGVRNTDTSSELWFGTEIGDTVDYRAKINTGGHFIPGTDSTYDLGLTGTRWRNVYADTLYGDGSNLTGIAADKIFENNSKVEVVDTGTGYITAEVDGTERLQVNSSGIDVDGDIFLDNGGSAGINFKRNGTLKADIEIASSSDEFAIRARGSNGFIKLSTGSSATERLRITSDGDVGIGYDSPTVKLHVREAASGFSGTYDNRYHIIVEDDAEAYVGFYVPDSGYAGIRFSDTTGLEGYLDYYFNTDEMVYSSTGSHYFKTAGSEKLRIQSGGNVMIGGNYTSTNLGKLCVDGVIGIDDEGSGTSTLNIMTAANTRLKIQATSSISQILTQNNVPFAIKTDAGTGGGTERLRITSTGSVNIGGDYTQSTYTMKVTGSFAATTKSFVIDHPTKEKLKLRYACLEGPENSVYVRGKTSDSVIELPDYWTGLVHEDSITVNVTPIGNHKVWVESINNNSVTIGSDGSEYFYTVFAERKDVDKLEVEVEE